MTEWIGQWIGSYESELSGNLLISVEPSGKQSIVQASAFPHDPSAPPSHVIFKVEGDPEHFSGRVDIETSRSPSSTDTLTPAQAEELGWILPKYVDLDISISGSVMNLSWITDIGTQAEGTATKASAEVFSAIKPFALGWEEFKRFAAGIIGQRRLVFRGQNKPFRLKTSFHRTGYTNIIRYNEMAIPQLHQTLSGQTRHFYAIDEPAQRGSFYALAQHYGFPTPLLDWTFSPFVAVYFALSGSPPLDPAARARLYIFDQELWHSTRPRVSTIGLIPPFVSVFNAVIIDNARLAPQQGLFTLTNVADIESYIISEQTKTRQNYLGCVDLPWSERDAILNELDLMGINAASLFPGVDGTCELFRRRMFGHPTL